MSNETGIYNPLKEDFRCRHAEYGVMEIPSREIAYFDPKIAPFIKKKLYDEIINSRDLNGIEINADPAKKKAILDEMEVGPLK